MPPTRRWPVARSPHFGADNNIHDVLNFDVRDEDTEVMSGRLGCITGHVEIGTWPQLYLYALLHSDFAHPFVYTTTEVRGLVLI